MSEKSQNEKLTAILNNRRGGRRARPKFPEPDDITYLNNITNLIDEYLKQIKEKEEDLGGDLYSPSSLASMIDYASGMETDARGVKRGEEQAGKAQKLLRGEAAGEAAREAAVEGEEEMNFAGGGKTRKRRDSVKKRKHKKKKQSSKKKQKGKKPRTRKNN